MTFTNLLTKQIIIARLTTVSGNKTTYTTVTAEYVSIQRMSDEKTVRIGGSIGKTFRLYTENNADIQKGDKLKDEDSNEYKVTGVNLPASLGNFEHFECVIELVK